MKNEMTRHEEFLLTMCIEADKGNEFAITLLEKHYGITVTDEGNCSSSIKAEPRKSIH
ncbi:hypothetical protein [Vibrio cholerae]|uniref:hypothetical protein n=1 Tax=Vibrio cholerae TaxID=666 RepID=UPI00155E422C|nr:hypothetical protein [Vibrio cholerae]EGQ8491624.1 hypothetical protein [Vibrio cholerae]EJL7928625.1 hypothetical protein [Vibrio cholerae]EMA2455349.1 hypothetical protein [Vibrio cholerae]NOE53860.1 hypothetical protein [Vibrio cholerae]GHZ39185.1 hypothetical protein VCSRO173_2494 [Vibrio cholerae]